MGRKSLDRSAGDVLLQVRGLRTHFFTEEGVVKAVDGVDFNVRRGEIFGLVGESGCGKTITALSILRLINTPGRIVAGEVVFRDTSFGELSEEEMTEFRGRKISMIFQNPQSSLNPVFTVAGQVAEILRIHYDLDKEEARQRAISLLKLMGIPEAERKANAYPHELSIGQSQRVMIAMALATEPDLLIADEPTTALDVTIQAQILDMLRQTCSRMSTAIILITHDLGVIAETTDRVAVMYAGAIVEKAGVDVLFAKPLHPYTQALMAAVPVVDGSPGIPKAIPGTAPNPVHLPSGCRFAPRCHMRVGFGLEICNAREPDELWIAPEHSVCCWLYQDVPGHAAPLRAV